MSIAQEVARKAFPEESKERSLRSGPVFTVMSLVIFPLFSQFDVRVIQIKKTCGSYFGYRHLRMPNGGWNDLPGFPVDLTMEDLYSTIKNYGFQVTPVHDVGSDKITLLYMALPSEF